MPKTVMRPAVMPSPDSYKRKTSEVPARGKGIKLAVVKEKTGAM